MATFYHLNPTTRMPELCDRSYDQACDCPKSAHFDTFEQALAAVQPMLDADRKDWAAFEQRVAVDAAYQYYSAEQLAKFYNQPIAVHVKRVREQLSSDLLVDLIEGRLYVTSDDERRYIDAALVSANLPENIYNQMLLHPERYQVRTLQILKQNPQLTAADKILIDINLEAR